MKIKHVDWQWNISNFPRIKFKNIYSILIKKCFTFYLDVIVSLVLVEKIVNLTSMNATRNPVRTAGPAETYPEASAVTARPAIEVRYNFSTLGQKKLIISFSGTAPLHFHMPHLSFYSVN